MAHVKELKEQFDLLPITEDNIELYERLLNLDHSEYVPIIEEILSGRMDIYDTKSLFYRHIPEPIDYGVIPTKLVTEDTSISSVVISNLHNRLFGGDIIQEAVVEINDDDLKEISADKFTEETGIVLSHDDRMKIITGRDTSVVIHTIIDNLTVDAKDIPAGMTLLEYKKALQLKYSSIITKKPIATV